MEVLDHPVKADEVEFRLWLDWQSDQSPRRQAWVASLLLHVLGIGALMLLPARVVREAPGLLAGLQRPTSLVAPPAELTQKAPNRGPIGKEFDLESLLPRPPLRIPPASPSATRPAASIPGPPALPEPPRIESSSTFAQAPPLGSGGLLLPPQIQVEERPKLAFEKPGAPAPTGIAGRVAVPSPSVSEAVRGAARSRSGLVVGDLGEGIGGIGEGLSLPPSPGRSGSSLELLSDPMGVDFRPYLIRILSAVRRNWFAVIPESAKLGRRGRVVIQFAIHRDGHVPKLVIASPSGAEALDRAAVAGVSASNPFPPLPSGYRGEDIRLQFTFLYNMPAH